MIKLILNSSNNSEESVEQFFNHLIEIGLPQVFKVEIIHFDVSVDNDWSHFNNKLNEFEAIGFDFEFQDGYSAGHASYILK